MDFYSNVFFQQFERMKPVVTEHIDLCNFDAAFSTC